MSEQGLQGTDDEPLLALAASDDRSLLTNSARDVLPLVARWAASGDAHCGLLLTSDSSMPRGKDSIGLNVQTLRQLMDANPARPALANQVRWLP